VASRGQNTANEIYDHEIKGRPRILGTSRRDLSYLGAGGRFFLIRRYDGKKGRMVAHIQVLAEVSALDAVSEACFTETTTLGLRRQIAQRAVLTRDASEHGATGDIVRVKAAQRPHGVTTAKTEIDDVAERSGGHAGRTRRRADAEQSALKDRQHDD